MFPHWKLYLDDIPLSCVFTLFDPRWTIDRPFLNKDAPAALLDSLLSDKVLERLTPRKNVQHFCQWEFLVKLTSIA